MAAYVLDVLTKAYQQNLVIKIGSTYFGAYQPDSGLTIDSDKLGTIVNVQVDPTQIDIRRVNTSVSSMTFTLLDKSGVVTTFLTSDDNFHMGDDVTLYVGRITGSSAFSGYQTIAKTKIRTINKGSNVYSFVTNEVTDRLRKTIFNAKTNLAVATSASGTGTITVDDASDFPSTGMFKVEDEFILYTGKTATTFTGITRAQLGSTAVVHAIGKELVSVTAVTENPITILQQILESTGTFAGGNDVLWDGLGIDGSLIDSTSFTDIKDEYFSTASFTLYLYAIEDAQDFIEQELLLPLGVRLFPAEGLITLGILDKAPTTIGVTDLDEDSIIGTPSYSVSAEEIINQIRVKWGYTEGTTTFANNTLFTEDDSITIYGKRPEITWEFKGIPDTDAGATFVTNLLNRMFPRLAYPVTEVTVRAQMDVSLDNPADVVRLVHSDLPATDSTAVGLNALVEVMSKAINFNTGDVTYTLNFSSFSNLRVGLIAPSPLIASVTSQTVFTVADGTCFRAGMYLRLYNDLTNTYYADAANMIASVISNTITMQSAFATTLTTSVRIKLADYEVGDAFTRASYAFISPNTGTFVSDSKTAYQILF